MKRISWSVPPIISGLQPVLPCSPMRGTQKHTHAPNQRQSITLSFAQSSTSETSRLSPWLCNPPRKQANLLHPLSGVLRGSLCGFTCSVEVIYCLSWTYCCQYPALSLLVEIRASSSKCVVSALRQGLCRVLSLCMQTACNEKNIRGLSHQMASPFRILFEEGRLRKFRRSHGDNSCGPNYAAYSGTRIHCLTLHRHLCIIIEKHLCSLHFLSTTAYIVRMDKIREEVITRRSAISS